MRAVIFDMDGVLFDSEPVYLALFYDYLISQGSTLAREDLHVVVGSSSHVVYEDIARRSGTGLDAATLRAGLVERAEAADIDYGRILDPDATGVLDGLRRRGLRVALASSAPRRFIDLALRAGGIADRFDLVVSGEQFRESKPNPEIYLHTLRALDVDARQALVVEDSQYGIMAAAGAGIRVAAVRDHRFGIDQSAADFHIDRLTEVWGIIDNDERGT
ncbi:HAD family hydrolase [Microbacterium sp.]|uniref:HAD family hydrolase n=1 Tax=Microbacterium sp. TaxID=51671 RepID=UPI0039E2A56F